MAQAGSAAADLVADLGLAAEGLEAAVAQAGLAAAGDTARLTLSR